MIQPVRLPREEFRNVGLRHCTDRNFALSGLRNTLTPLCVA